MASRFLSFRGDGSVDFEKCFAFLSELEQQSPTGTLQLLKFLILTSFHDESSLCVSEFKRELSTLLIQANEFDQHEHEVPIQLELLLNYVYLGRDEHSSLGEFVEDIVDYPYVPQSPDISSPQSLMDAFVPFVYNNFLLDKNISEVAEFLNRILKHESSEICLYRSHPECSKAELTRILALPATEINEAALQYLRCLLPVRLGTVDLVSGVYSMFAKDTINSGKSENPLSREIGLSADKLADLVDTLKELEDRLSVRGPSIASWTQSYQTDAIKLELMAFVKKAFSLSDPKLPDRHFTLANQENVERILSLIDTHLKEEYLVQCFETCVSESTQLIHADKSDIGDLGLVFSLGVYILLVEALVNEILCRKGAIPKLRAPMQLLFDFLHKATQTNILDFLEEYAYKTAKNPYLQDLNQEVFKVFRELYLTDLEPFFNIEVQEESFWKSKANILKYLRLRRSYWHLFGYKLLPFESTAQNYNIDKLKAIFSRGCKNVENF
jgi:hypothetical protein